MAFSQWKFVAYGCILLNVLESLVGIILPLIGGLSFISLMDALFSLFVFCTAWILFSGFNRMNPKTLILWWSLYIMFFFVRLTLLVIVILSLEDITNQRPLMFKSLFAVDGFEEGMDNQELVRRMIILSSTLAVQQTVSTVLLVAVLTQILSMKKRLRVEAFGNAQPQSAVYQPTL